MENNPLIAEINADVLREKPLPQYADDSDKSSYGKLLILAGSRRLPGAAILAARAALRSSCGTVRIAAPESVAVAIGAQLPEAMVLPLPETQSGTAALDSFSRIEEQWQACDAALIGPGLDEDEETYVLLRRLALETPLPTVLDASALIALEGTKPKFLFPRILTPHRQEMSTLLAQSGKKVSLEENAGRFARESRCTLALKGRETLVYTVDGKTYRNTAGTRGLGTAGSGDVLAGIIAGLSTQFAAQEIEEGPLRATLWGIYLHALSGEAAEKDLGDDGMIASDLITRLPGVMRYLKKTTAPKTDLRTGLRPLAS